jgi:hypothetical protein
LDFFDTIGKDLLAVIEEVHRKGHMHDPLNSTFIALIPKSDSLQSLDDFRPISLCNCIYKIVAKVIARRLKKVFSASISKEQFGFLEGRQIHEAIGVAQEGIHSIKTKKLKGEVLKIDLSKAYDWVNWLYIRLLLTHLGFEIDFIRWVMCCIYSASFVVLINGSASPFFRAERGLHQGCPLSPLLFLLVAEGLSRALESTKSNREFEGIAIYPTLRVTHLLFVDDVIIFCNGSRRDAGKLHDILDLFSLATGMVINGGKSMIITQNMDEEEIEEYRNFFSFEIKGLDAGLKYLGFHLKPNSYKKVDWMWLLAKMEKRLNIWSFKWLSQEGRLVLVKSVLEVIPVYWMSLAWIPKGIMEKIRKLCLKFLWEGAQDKFVIPWVKWSSLALPKYLGGWGLKNIFLFSKSLAANSSWRLITTDSLWTQVVIQKYIRPASIQDWIRNPLKRFPLASIIWKALVSSFDVIGDSLAWRIGKGNQVWIGRDPWPGCRGAHILSENLIQSLHDKGYLFLSQVGDP